jgi:hypothetical protein
MADENVLFFTIAFLESEQYFSNRASSMKQQQERQLNPVTLCDGRNHYLSFYLYVLTIIPSRISTTELETNPPERLKSSAIRQR